MSRASATVRQVAELSYFLLHVSFALQPGNFYAERLLAAVGAPRADILSYRLRNPGHRVLIGPEFHADLDFWRWLVVEGLDARGGQLYSPVYCTTALRPLRRTLFSDASNSAVGGYCVETGRYWLYDLTTEETYRFCGASKQVVGMQESKQVVGMQDTFH